MINNQNLAVLSEKVALLEVAIKNAGSSLPEVTSADNGDVLGVVDGVWNKMAAPSGGVDYTFTEQNTGLKFGDKIVYQKSYTGTLAGSGSTTTLEELFEYNIIEANGYFTNTEGLGISLGDLNTSGWLANVHLTTGKKLVVFNGNALVGGHYNVTIRYTKD